MPYNSSIKQITDCQILNGGFCLNPSLLEGKMGIALFFFFQARYTHNNWYEDFAGELLDDICDNLHIGLPITFADGLCGIGWGIELMKRLNFIEGDTDDILCDIDRKIMERDVRRMSDMTFEYGLEGIAIYVRSRIDSVRTIKNNQPFDSSYLKELEEACQRNNILLYSMQYNTDSTWNRILDLLATHPFSKEKSWKRGLVKLRTIYE